MDLQKAIITFVLFSFLLIIPSAVGAVKTFHVQENDLVTISPEVLDPDNDDVIYSFSPPLDKNGRWQTGYGDAGEYLLTIVAFDGKSQTKKEIILIVENKNQPPYLKEKKIVVKELQSLDLKPFVADPDGDPLEFVFTTPFDKNGLWTPGYNDQSTFVAKFSVKDGGFTVPMRLEVEVLNTNQPPTIKDSFSVEDVVSVDENEELSFYIEAEDGDGDTLSYAWTLDNLSISAKKNGKHFFNYESTGKYELTAIITDKQGHKVERTWNLNVADVNRKPEVGLPPITVKEGESITLELPEKDADGDYLTYSFKKKFDDQGVWQTTFDDAGVYDVEYEVSDGENRVKEQVEITILDVDRAPELILPERLEVKEGEKLSFFVEATDPDGDEVNVSFVNAPEGALFDLDDNMFSWSPGYNYIKRRGGMFSNILNSLRLEQRLLREKKEVLEVRACSQELCSTGRVTLIIYNANQAPVLELPSTLIITESEELQLQPQAHDSDEDIVRYYFTGPAHKRKGTWQTAYEDAGEYTIYVTASDGLASHTQPVIIKVLQKNRQPTVLVSDDEYMLHEGEEFVLPVEAFDDDNDSLSLTVENLPEGASFKNNTLVWKPDYDFTPSKDRGNFPLSEVSSLSPSEEKKREHWISLVASDKEFDVHYPVKLVVSNVNRKPEIQYFAPLNPLTLHQHKPLNFSVTALDKDGDNLTYVWTFEPGSERIVGSNFIERTFVTPGEKKVSIVVSDGQYEVSQEWTITVSEEVVPNIVALEEPKFRVYVIEY